MFDGIAGPEESSEFFLLVFDNTTERNQKFLAVLSKVIFFRFFHSPGSLYIFPSLVLSLVLAVSLFVFLTSLPIHVSYFYSSFFGWGINLITYKFCSCIN